MAKIKIVDIIYPNLLSSFHLKMIAIIAMIIDHTGSVLFPDDFSFRIVGRISFILFAFLISEGVIYSHNLYKYAKRLLLWAFLSEIPYDIAIHGKVFEWQHQNIFFTLFLGVAGLSLFKMYSSSKALKYIALIIPLVSAFFLKVDYSYYGILVIYLFYFFKKNKLLQFISITSTSVFYAISAFPLQLFAFLGFLPIYFYSGNLGLKMGKQLYSFYAIHLIILFLIKTAFG